MRTSKPQTNPNGLLLTRTQLLLPELRTRQQQQQQQQRLTKANKSDKVKSFQTSQYMHDVGTAAASYSNGAAAAP
jgi:hypothetical protein